MRLHDALERSTQRRSHVLRPPRPDARMVARPLHALLARAPFPRCITNDGRVATSASLALGRSPAQFVSARAPCLSHARRID